MAWPTVACAQIQAITPDGGAHNLPLILIAVLQVLTGVAGVRSPN
jgi:hypothetical protein